MSEVSAQAPAMTAAELEKLLLSIPTDVAGTFMRQLQEAKAAHEFNVKRQGILQGVESILEAVSEDLTKVIPEGFELRVRHLAPVKDANGSVTHPARLVFDVDGGGMASTGAAKVGRPRAGSKVCKVELDGETIQASTWRAILDEVDSRLKAKGREKEAIGVPATAFSAHDRVRRAANRIKGLKYVGEEAADGNGKDEADGGEAPKVEAPAPTPAPEGDKK